MGDKWFETYEGQTTEELLAMRDDYRIDSLVLAFEAAIQKKALSDQLSPQEWGVLAIEALEREVNNGGYDQFFFNTRGKFLDVIVEALRAINCPITAAVTGCAIAALGVAIDAPEEVLIEMLLADDPGRENALDECDKRYYESGEPIADRLLDWIGRHRALVTLHAI